MSRQLDVNKTALELADKAHDRQWIDHETRIREIKSIMDNQAGRLWAIGAAVTIINLVIGVIVFLGK